MIFLQVVTKLDRLSVYFSLFRLEMCLRGRMVNTLRFSPTAEDRAVDLIPVQRGCFGVCFRLYVQ